MKFKNFDFCPKGALNSKLEEECFAPCQLRCELALCLPSVPEMVQSNLLFFPDISSERLRVCGDRSPPSVLWKSRLGYVYWNGFSNALSVPRCPFQRFLLRHRTNAVADSGHNHFATSEADIGRLELDSRTSRRYSRLAQSQRRRPSAGRPARRCLPPPSRTTASGRPSDQL